jgi:hypothetical protein
VTRARHLATVAALAALGAAALAGCGGGRQTRRDVYVNLMTPDQRAHYLEMEADEEPASLRLAYLQGIGVYQDWVKQPKKVQDAILARRVEEGMTPLQVRMAWGPPDEVRDVTQPAERAAGHERIVWKYLHWGNKVSVAYGRSVCFLDGEVLWVRDAG